MKRIQMFLIIFFLITFNSCKGQVDERSLKISDFQFESIFGTTDKEPYNIYCLLGTGFFRAPSSNNADSLIIEWINTHPNAVVLPVSSFGPLKPEKSESKMIYCWVMESQDTLNNYLIKNGCFPGGTMMRPETWKELKKWEKKFYKEVNEKTDIKIYVNKKTYDTFIEQIKKAELFARDSKLGIWAEKVKNEDNKE